MAEAILTVLGSGSRGNALHLEHRGTALLVDAGLSAKQLEMRLEEVDAVQAELLGVILTHEHGDHTAGLKTFLKKRKIPLYASHGTKDALEPDLATVEWRSFEAGAELAVGEFRPKLERWIPKWPAWGRAWADRAERQRWASRNQAPVSPLRPCWA